MRPEKILIEGGKTKLDEINFLNIKNVNIQNITKNLTGIVKINELYNDLSFDNNTIQYTIVTAKNKLMSQKKNYSL